MFTLLEVGNALADTDPPPEQNSRLGELLHLDIDDLMRLPVRLASRSDEAQFQAPAAAYVITQDDIRRSGLRRLPELLRLVPGLHVGKIDANKWAISSRNTQSRFSRTMLVLMDGRTVYSPLFSGVYWDVQDTLLEDIERIEVIRGPGSVLWGSNAVDGVINIVTKSAAQTRGGLAYAGGGEGEMRGEAGARVGGEPMPGVATRLYAKGFKTDTGTYLDASESTNGGSYPVGGAAYDDGRQWQSGFRADWATRTQGSITFQGDVYDGTYHDVRTASPMLNTVNARGHNLIARWTRPVSAGSELRLQAYYDYTERSDFSFNDSRTIGDVELQHSFALPRQQFVWGMGYRTIRDETSKTPTGTFALVPPERKDHLASAYLQDRITLSDRTLFAILGVRVEDNTYTDGEFAPNGRLLWTPDADNTVWLAASRAVSVPSRAESDAVLDFGGGTVVPIGNSKIESRYANVYELGYRRQLTRASLVDIAVFDNRYDNTYQPGVDSSPAGANTESYGAEVLGRWQVSTGYRLEAWYAYIRSLGLNSAGNEVELTNVPRHSAHLRSYWDIHPAAGLDVLLYYVDQSGGTTLKASSYVRLDVRLAWRPSKALEASLLLTNLLDDVHPEAFDVTRVNSGVPRGAFFKLAYQWQ